MAFVLKTENQLVQTKKKKSLRKACSLDNQNVKPRSKVVHFFFVVFFFLFFVFSLYFMKMEDMQWIEDVVQSTGTPLFLTNFKLDIASFVDPCKVVVKKECIF
jgi:hypothetical protein